MQLIGICKTDGYLSIGYNGSLHQRTLNMTRGIQSHSSDQMLMSNLGGVELLA